MEMNPNEKKKLYIIETVRSRKRSKKQYRKILALFNIFEKCNFKTTCTLKFDSYKIL